MTSKLDSQEETFMHADGLTGSTRMSSATIPCCGLRQRIPWAMGPVVILRWYAEEHRMEKD